MNSSTDTHLAMEDYCPALEDLAAFLDGTLRAEERERIVAHLADCETCYEIFAGAAHFQLDSEEVEVAAAALALPFDDNRVSQKPRAQDPPSPVSPLPSPSPWQAAPKALEIPSRTRRPTPRWLAAAALVLLAIGIGSPAYLHLLAQPEMTVAELTTPLASNPVTAGDLYEGQVMRSLGGEGPGPLSVAPEFMVGVLLVDLRLSAPQGDRERSARLIQGIANQLGSFVEAKDVQDRYYGEYRKLYAATSDEAAALLSKVAREIPAREQKLESLSTSPESLAFGKWAEAGRVAARLREPEFFERRKNRRFLGWLLRHQEVLGLEEGEQVLPLLQEIDRLWDPGRSKERDYKGLETAFDGIIDHYDRLANLDDQLITP